MAQALLGLGGNVGDVRATLDKAVAQFADGADVTLLARSSDYRTPPWGVEEQPPFVNLAVAVETELSPRARPVARARGRDRATPTRGGPRPTDIARLAYDDLPPHDPGLPLPHPR